MSDVNLPTSSYAVLGLLSFGRKLSGYEIRRWALASLRHFYWSPAQSQIYRELRRLEELGLVSAETVAQRDRPDKTMYSLTEPGHAELVRWVEGPVPEPPVVKHPALLRLFFGHVANPERLADIVAAHGDGVDATTGELEELLVGLEDAPEADYPRLATQWALEIHRGDLAGNRLGAETLRRLQGE
ncbi:MAG: PadR family transcriptional regulator [Acidimicrobiia bacterium]|nr:PadR family transcriptional regulator [Acidimicrobiia bacterium]